MKRTVLSVLVSVAFVLTASAQDVIKLKDGKEIQAKISEITQTEIKYKSFDYQDGPTFTIYKSDVSTITYANGMTEEIKAEAQPKPAQSSSSEESGSFWKPELYTNQVIASISPYFDLGGFILSGGKLGVEARWRRLAVDIAYKTTPSMYFWTNDNYGDGNWELESLSGSGFAYTFKVYLPKPNSRTLFHLGMENEISDYKYTYRHTTSYDETEDWTTSYYSTGLGGGFTHFTKSGLFFRASAYFGISVGNGSYKNEENTPGTYGMIHSVNWSYPQTWVDCFGTIEAAIGFEIPTVKKR